MQIALQTSSLETISAFSLHAAFKGVVLQKIWEEKLFLKIKLKYLQKKKKNIFIYKNFWF